MKKLFVLLFIAMILIGCSEKESKATIDKPKANELLNQEALEFIKKYNENVNFLNDGKNDISRIEIIDAENVGKINKEEKLDWQEIYRNSDYKISVKYNKDGGVIGYHLYISGEDQYNNNGLAAAVIIIETLGLDRSLYRDKLNEMLNSPEEKETVDVLYEDQDYQVDLFDTKELGKLVMNFDKLE